MKKVLLISVLVGLVGTVYGQWDITVRVSVPAENIATVKAAVDKYPPLYATSNVVKVVNNITRTNVVRVVVAETDRIKFKRLLSEGLQMHVDSIIQRGRAKAATVGD